MAVMDVMNGIFLSFEHNDHLEHNEHYGLKVVSTVSIITVLRLFRSFQHISKKTGVDDIFGFDCRFACHIMP
jgi:hypothetical protein